MRGDRIPTKILSVRIISQVEDSLKECLGLQKEERSIGLLTLDADDVGYAAIDEATKMAAVRVCYAQSMYAGSLNANTALAGEFLAILAGPNPEEVKSGLQAACDYIRDDCSFYSANEDDSIIYFAHCISRTGSYLSNQSGISEGLPLAYLIAPPLESVVGLDAALKEAEVEMVKFYGPPTETNFGGGLLTGEQAACKAACEAFERAILEVAEEPIRYV